MLSWIIGNEIFKKNTKSTNYVGKVDVREAVAAQLWPFKWNQVHETLLLSVAIAPTDIR